VPAIARSWLISIQAAAASRRGSVELGHTGPHRTIQVVVGFIGDHQGSFQGHARAIDGVAQPT